MPLKSREHLKNPITYFTGILVIVGVVQTWAFIQSQRAFVAPTEINFAKQLVVGMNPLPMYLDIRNSGKSTAVIEELSVAITHKLPREPRYIGAQKIAFAPIVPGGTSRRSLRFETGWSEETTNAVTSGTMKFYVFGVIKYRDFGSEIFGPRETGFCFIYVPNGDTSNPVFENCQERPYTYAR